MEAYLEAYLVVVERPKGVSRSEMRDFIEESVTDHASLLWGDVEEEEYRGPKKVCRAEEIEPRVFKALLNGRASWMLGE
jgi:hypothetical protein